MNCLDLFCGAGGATKGMQLADRGVRVTGVDAQRQPRYCGNSFARMNVFDINIDWAKTFDFVWASPPCQAYVSRADRPNHHDLISQTRTLLQRIGKPWVIENVATAPLDHYILLCGTMFPLLRVVRHRLFEFSNDLQLYAPAHISKSEHPAVYSFDKRRRRRRNLNEDDNYVTVAGNNCSLGAASDAMGIYWMTRPEIAEAVPPVYARYIMQQVIKQHKNREAQKDGVPSRA